VQIKIFLQDVFGRHDGIGKLFRSAEAFERAMLAVYFASFNNFAISWGVAEKIVGSAERANLVWGELVAHGLAHDPTALMESQGIKVTDALAARKFFELRCIETRDDIGRNDALIKFCIKTGLTPETSAAVAEYFETPMEFFILC
jgi:hypothetical protein